jgi:hypothetical protein
MVLEIHKHKKTLHLVTEISFDLVLVVFMVDSLVLLLRSLKRERVKDQIILFLVDLFVFRRYSIRLIPNSGMTIDVDRDILGSFEKQRH